MESGAQRPRRARHVDLTGSEGLARQPMPNGLAEAYREEGESITIRLEGTIKNAVSTSEGEVRVGIEFDWLSESEQGTTAVQSTESGRDGERPHRMRSR